MSAAAPAPRLSRSDDNFYADSGLDRAGEQRRDPAWIAGKLADPATRFVPLWRSRNCIDAESGRPITLAAKHYRAFRRPKDEPVFLGLAGDAAYFAFDLSHLDGGENGPELPGVPAHAISFGDLRLHGPSLERAEGGLLAYARGMLTWHRRHRFCGQCGGPTRSADGGHVRRCADDSCKLEQFPRTDPAVIMLVTHGDSCLLGSNPRFPPGMYSTLAGFVEPGETLEAAVAREVFEEAGVRVRDVRYHSSQPWPFPTSLMLGFYAAADDEALAVNAAELADARWFERGWLAANARDFHEEGAALRLPRRDSIARRLIDDWLTGAA